MRQIEPFHETCLEIRTPRTGEYLFFCNIPRGTLYHYSMAVGSCSGGNQPKDTMMQKALEVLTMRPNSTVQGALKDELFALSMEFYSTHKRGEVARAYALPPAVPKIEKLRRSFENETLFDLAVMLGADLSGDKIDRRERTGECFADSRGHQDVLIGWANEFNFKNAGREWDGEYMDEIEDFYNVKIAPFYHA